MIPAEVARALLASASVIVHLDDDDAINELARMFLQPLGVETGAVIGALSALGNEAIRMLSDEQRAEYWRKVDAVVARYKEESA